MSTFEERRKKYSRNKEKIEKEGAKLNLDITMMDMFVGYCLSENDSIHHASLSMLRNVLNKIDVDIFEGNNDLVVRYNLCLDLLSARLDNGINRKDILIKAVNGIVGNKYETIDLYSYKELSDNDVIWVENSIGSCMNILFINNKIMELVNVGSEYISSGMNDKERLLPDIQNKVTEMQTAFRRNMIDSEEKNDTINLADYVSAFSDLYDNVTRPTFKLKTGIQGLNDVIAGGFMGGCVYSLFGLPGEGKTTTLINLALQIKKFNPKYVCHDKTKSPVVLYFTMENKSEQIIETMFNITCSPEPIQNFTKEEVIQMAGSKLSASAESPINIVVKYRPINSVSTEYIYKIIDDLSDEGYETICVIMDYMKRIRPVDKTGDMRIDIGNVVNDFRNLAIHYDIPVVTASQFNREGVRMIDSSRDDSKHDLVSKLGRAMIGESGLIDENLDWTIFIQPEWVGEKKYMGFRCVKHRFKISTTVTEFYQPFYEDNPIKYICDAGASSPAYKLSLDDASLHMDEVKEHNKEINFGFRRNVKDLMNSKFEKKNDDNDKVEEMVESGNITPFGSAAIFGNASVYSQKDNSKIMGAGYTDRKLFKRIAFRPSKLLQIAFRPSKVDHRNKI